MEDKLTDEELAAILRDFTNYDCQTHEALDVKRLVMRLGTGLQAARKRIHIQEITLRGYSDADTHLRESEHEAIERAEAAESRLRAVEAALDAHHRAADIIVCDFPECEALSRTRRRAGEKGGK